MQSKRKKIHNTKKDALRRLFFMHLLRGIRKDVTPVASPEIRIMRVSGLVTTSWNCNLWNLGIRRNLGSIETPRKNPGIRRNLDSVRRHGNVNPESRWNLDSMRRHRGDVSTGGDYKMAIGFFIAIPL